MLGIDLNFASLNISLCFDVSGKRGGGRGGGELAGNRRERKGRAGEGGEGGRAGEGGKGGRKGREGLEPDPRRAQSWNGTQTHR